MDPRGPFPSWFTSWVQHVESSLSMFEPQWLNSPFDG